MGGVFVHKVLLFICFKMQKMVVSLSQDRAVWDAILNNEVVRELRESCHGGDFINP